MRPTEDKKLVSTIRETEQIANIQKRLKEELNDVNIRKGRSGKRAVLHIYLRH